MFMGFVLLLVYADFNTIIASEQNDSNRPANSVVWQQKAVKSQIFIKQDCLENPWHWTMIMICLFIYHNIMHVLFKQN